jgi:hypothetical protein
VIEGVSGAGSDLETQVDACIRLLKYSSALLATLVPIVYAARARVVEHARWRSEWSLSDKGELSKELVIFAAEAAAGFPFTSWSGLLTDDDVEKLVTAWWSLHSSSGEGLVPAENDLCDRLRQAGRRLTKHPRFEQWQRDYRLVDSILLLEGGEDAIPPKKRSRRSSGLENIQRARKIIRRTRAVLGEVDAHMSSAEETGAIGDESRSSIIARMHLACGDSGIPQEIVSSMTYDVERVLRGTASDDDGGESSEEELDEEEEEA